MPKITVICATSGAVVDVTEAWTIPNARLGSLLKRPATLKDHTCNSFTFEEKERFERIPGSDERRSLDLVPLQEVRKQLLAKMKVKSRKLKTSVKSPAKVLVPVPAPAPVPVERELAGVS